MEKTKIILKSEKGSALVYVVLGSFILAIASYVITERMRAAAFRKANIEAEKEIEKIEQTIVAAISSPSHCNAAFQNENRSAAVGSYITTPNSTGFRTCSAADCPNTAISRTSPPTFPIFNATDTWTAYNSTFAGETTTFKRARIVRMMYVARSAQVTGWGDAGVPARYELEITLQKNTSPFASTAAPRLSTLKPKVYTFFVTEYNFNTTTGNWDRQGTIVGCAKSPNSTTPY